jgi:hypothetical protein
VKKVKKKLWIDRVSWNQLGVGLVDAYVYIMRCVAMNLVAKPHLTTLCETM